MTLPEYLAAYPKKYLIFDFDETIMHLLLPWGIHVDKMDAILRSYNPEFYEHQDKNMRSEDLVNEFVKKFGDDIYQRTRAWSAEFESKYLEGVNTNPELVEWIKVNKDSYLMYVWTSNCSTTVNPILKDRQLAECFQLVICKDMVRLTKPEPDGFAQIFESVKSKSGDEPQLSEFLMIGDSDADRGAAENSGIDFYRVKYF